MMRLRLTLIALLLLGARFGLAEPSIEYQVKAVCVLNAARFVSWPATSFANADAPLVIGILGDNPFGSTLQDAVAGETIRQRRIVVRRVNLSDAASTCHIVFISRSERDRLDAILNTLGAESILTVSEIDHFAAAGGVLTLGLDRGKIRFEVNQAAATQARLRIDSQFLLLARGSK
jgi:hypothetical protein